MTGHKCDCALGCSKLSCLAKACLQSFESSFVSKQAALSHGANPSTLKKMRKAARAACAAVESQLQSRRLHASNRIGKEGGEKLQQRHPIVEAALASLAPQVSPA